MNVCYAWEREYFTFDREGKKVPTINNVILLHKMLYWWFNCLTISNSLKLYVKDVKFACESLGVNKNKLFFADLIK